MATSPPKVPSPVDILLRRRRLRPIETLPWAIAVAVYFAFPTYLPLGTEILIMVLFALSLDLILGYAGIVTLGHAAFFGVGAYTAGILAANGWSEPTSGLVAAGLMAGIVGVVSGFIILRTHGVTLLMLTLAVVFMLHEAANKAGFITGGADGLQGMVVDPLFGAFRFDMFGRTAYLYALAVLFLAWLFARLLVHSPFGRSLTGIRENVTRMHAIGSPVHRRLVAIYAISAVLAGIAGGLLAQTTQAVALTVVTFERSGGILVMLILGGAGRLYGAFVGAPAFMLAQDTLAKSDPVYWLFWIGLMLVLVVMFARGGILGLVDAALHLARRLRR
ncbi:MAG: branched-chain amino acid ABC transporter permease [Rhodospirillales bacterium]|nr:branched-chain amino acid ABC transporter permease [Rhodospirillales bacterium]